MEPAGRFRATPEMFEGCQGFSGSPDRSRFNNNSNINNNNTKKKGGENKETREAMPQRTAQRNAPGCSRRRPCRAWRASSVKGDGSANRIGSFEHGIPPHQTPATVKKTKPNQTKPNQKKTKHGDKNSVKSQHRSIQQNTKR